MTRKFTSYTERYGSAAPVLWLIDELWDQQNERTDARLAGRDPDLPSNVTPIGKARKGGVL